MPAVPVRRASGVPAVPSRRVVRECPSNVIPVLLVANERVIGPELAVCTSSPIKSASPIDLIYKD